MPPTKRDVLVDVAPQVCLEASKLLFAVISKLLACTKVSMLSGLVAGCFKPSCKPCRLGLTLNIALLFLKCLVCKAVGDPQLPRLDLTAEQLYVSSTQTYRQPRRQLAATGETWPLTVRQLQHRPVVETSPVLALSTAGGASFTIWLFISV